MKCKHALILLMCLSLMACGQRGPLYLPEEPVKQNPSVSQEMI